MKVVFLAGHLSQRASGVRQMVEGLSGALGRQGLDVRVFGRSDADWLAGDAARWRGAPAQVFAVRGPAGFGYMPGLAAALAAEAPDIVHLHGLWMHNAKVAGDWAGATRGRLVISPHGMLAPKALRYSRARKRLAGLVFQDRCFARAAGFHATSDAEADDIRAALGARAVAVIANGVEETQAAPGAWAARPRRVVALGRLHPVKGYDLLLEAWARVEPRFPGWSLEIAGPDPDGYGARLRGLAASLGLTRAEIGPARFGPARDGFMSDARLFALPSLTENFALTVPEALVCGTPVLASTGAPWRGLLDNGCGWWVAPEPGALAAALAEAMALPDADLEARGLAGRSWALSAFGWDEIATRMAAFYKALASGGGMA